MGGSLEAARRGKMNAEKKPVDPAAVTQPTRPSSLDAFQRVRINPTPIEPITPPGPSKPTQSLQSAKKSHGCLWLCLFVFVLLPLAYFLAPFRTNFLVLGIDSGLGRGELGRTDTIILGTVVPLKPYVGLLSIPRDLWVPIEGVGENRINTAYFYAEAQASGSGPQAAMRVVSQNFKVPVNYYVVLRMDGLLDFIDAMGGVDISLAAPISGFEAGTHHLDGTTALAFARSRANSDDFARMKQAQVLIKAVMQRLLQPEVWPRLPQIINATKAVVNTNIPVWQWPRLGLALVRSGRANLESRTITREMVHPFTTNLGAQVLAPDWEAIGKLTKEMFGR